MQKQREYIRFNIEGEVVLKPADGTSRVIKTELIDISFSGFSVFSVEKIEADVLVDLELATKVSGEQVSGQGRIRYLQQEIRESKDGFKIGIEFINIDTRIVQGIINRLQLALSAKARRSAS